MRAKLQHALKATGHTFADSITYGAVQQTMKHICDKYPGVKYVEVPVQLPQMSHADIVRATEQALDTHGGDNSSRKLVVVDSIASVPAVRMPWQAIVELCASRPNTLSIVDAAHSLGQEPVDLSREPRPDFWLSNAHKWLFAHRGVAALFVRKDRQNLMRTSLPTGHGYVSERYPDGRSWTWVDQWEWTGTQDWAPALSIPAGTCLVLLDSSSFVRSSLTLTLFGSDRIPKVSRRRTSDPSLLQLTRRRGRSPCRLDPRHRGPGQRIGRTQARYRNGRCSITDRCDARKGARLARLADGCAIRCRFLCRSGEWPCCPCLARPILIKDVWQYVYNGSWWARMSAQVWNEASDFERCATTLLALCDRVNDGSWKKEVLA